MGCFSWLCEHCGEPILSDSFNGDRCKLFLVYEGEIIEHMTGKYDSYGNVFGVDEWKNDWSKIVDLMFNDDKSSGIVAYHEECFNDNKYSWTEVEKIGNSKPDPDQGWGYEKADKSRWKNKSDVFDHGVIKVRLTEDIIPSKKSGGKEKSN